jgi:hypothetical protein
MTAPVASTQDTARPVLLASSTRGVVHQAVPDPGRTAGEWWRLVCRPDEPRHTTALEETQSPVNCWLCKAKGAV